MVLRFDVTEQIATITMENEGKHNAFTLEMIDDWLEALRKVAETDDIRVAILTGAGTSFCSGVDLDSLASVDSTPLARREMLTKRIHNIAYAVQALEKPLICAMNGVAVGAGLDMALMCDIRLAAESARFSEGYINAGLVPGDGGCYYLPRLVGSARALEMLWTGDSISASEAESIGLVNHVIPDDRLRGETWAMAKKLASRSPVAIGMIKRAVYQGMRSGDLQLSLDLIASHMGVVSSLEDSAEAMAALRERREPIFRGR